MARPERACLSEAEVAEALIAVVEAEASTVAAAEEDLDEGAVVEALINFKIKGLQNVSSC